MERAELHPRLCQELQRIGIADVEAPPRKDAWAALLDRVSRSYADADRDAGAAVFPDRRSDPTELILRSVSEGICRLDRDGRFTYVNPAAARMLGWEPADLIGRFEHEALHHSSSDGSTLSRDDCRILRSMSDGELRRVEGELFRRRDGSSIPVECTSTPILENGSVTGAVIGFSDITERRVLQAQLVQAQKLESIGQLAAGIAHEINTPIQYVGSNTSFLKDSMKDLCALLAKHGELLEMAKRSGAFPEKVAELEGFTKTVSADFLLEEIPKSIDQSLEGVDRVSTIVRAMKEFSHPGADEKTAVDVNKGIESTVTVSRNEWKYVADVVLDLDRSLPQVPGLAGEINQVILNLLLNATHAIADVVASHGDGGKGTIRISTSRRGEFVEIRISDTGTGIPESIRHRVFDPFFTTKPVGKGTGQGLALARSIVHDKHGGSISFESECGKGTTFAIRLPIAGQGGRA